MECPQTRDMDFRKGGHARAITRDVDPEPVHRFMNIGEIGCRGGEGRKEIFLELFQVFLDLLDRVHPG